MEGREYSFKSNWLVTNLFKTLRDKHLYIVIFHIFLLIPSLFILGDFFLSNFFIFMKNYLYFSFGLLENNLKFYICLLLISFIHLTFIQSFKVSIIKVLSILLCFNIMKTFVIFFMKISNLYTSYLLIYSYNFFGNFLNLEYSIGMDNISLIFIGLTVFLIPICLIISCNNIYYNLKSFFLLYLILEILLINVFLATDLVLFYIAFETILIPMYLLIGFWGSSVRKVHAAYLFFLYTLGGSLFMLIALIFCQLNVGSTNINILLNFTFSPYRELFLWFFFFIGFAVKIPMMPVHLWLPEAHVESPTSGSVALAGILLKLGTYGILRFLIPLFQFSSVFFSPFVFLLSFFGVFYASLTTLRQIDLKKIIAYSSVIHMNYLMFGLFSFNLEGLVGSLILMVAHGFVSGGLFACIGVLYDRYHTRLQKPYGGLNYFNPIFSSFFLIFILGNISFPGTINFLGEFLVLLSIFIKNIFLGISIMFLMILSTCYSLWLYNKVFSGLIVKNLFLLKTKSCGILFKILEFHRFFLLNNSDLNLREFISLFYLLLPVFYLGLHPKYLINLVEVVFSNLLTF